MDCLLHRIGIRGCDAAVPSPEPNLYVNDLPGITSDFINAIVNDDDETFLVLWNKVQKRAHIKFDLLVKAELNKCYKITDNVEVACLVCEKSDLFEVPLWYFLGTEFLIECTSTDVISRYNSIDLEKIEKLKSEFYTEFTAALSDAVQGLNPADSDCIKGCIECNDDVKFVMQTP